jgi:predicted HAD superfamily Cof-like phosphohydrolase
MDFHRALGIPVGNSPEIRRPELRANLIMEEAVETCEALMGMPIEWGYRPPMNKEPNLLGVIDGVCDILCVTYGTAVECGFDVEPFWAEVHRTNMLKQGGPVRSDGKILKPEGWQPPNLAMLLERQMWNGHVNGCELFMQNGEMQHKPGPGCEWV